jgi:WD40 repeat protein
MKKKIHSMAFLVASSSADGSIILWNFSIGLPHKTLKPHTFVANAPTTKISSIDFSKDGKLLVKKFFFYSIFFFRYFVISFFFFIEFVISFFVCFFIIRFLVEMIKK